MTAARAALMALGLSTGLVATSITATSCGEPTCEDACARVFYTCGFDYEESAHGTEDHVDSCVAACRQALTLPARELEAITWMQCVSTYPCETLPDDPHGYVLRETCPPDDYYLGDLTAP